MAASRLIHYFSSHMAASGFQASSSHNNISMNPGNKKTYQCLSDFQTGICAAAHATLDTEQLISCTRASLVDAIASLQGSDGRVISVLGVHELLTKIHDILGSAVSKQVG